LAHAAPRRLSDVDAKGSIMAVVLIPLPHRDFDPTEAGVPWRVLHQGGHRVVFATPDGGPAAADPRTLTGEGLGIFAPFMKADANGRSAYDEMIRSAEFRHPIPYPAIRSTATDAMILPGGHAPGMRPYLESAELQAFVAELLDSDKPGGAICHGVLIAARARRADGKSVLYGRKTTALPKMMELTGWLLTRPWLGNYFRTYPTTVEDEVRASLADRNDFVRGPMSIRRDSPRRLATGFTVRDRNFLSARWPGDAHRFAHDFAAMLGQSG
jgi:protease I